MAAFAARRVSVAAAVAALGAIGYACEPFKNKSCLLLAACDSNRQTSNTGDIDYIRARFTAFPNFPKPGVNFLDIFSVLQDPVASQKIINLFVDFIRENHGKVDVIVGLESKGFLWGPAVAIALGASFVPIRKRGKLPGECHNITYTLEYGSDCFEIQKGSIRPGQRVVILDDLIATGGTLQAGVELVNCCGGRVVQALCVTELASLNGRARVSAPVHAFIVS